MANHPTNIRIKFGRFDSEDEGGNIAAILMAATGSPERCAII